MNDEALPTLWMSAPGAASDALPAAITAVLREDEALRDRERRTRVASIVALVMLSPSLLWAAAFAAHAIIAVRPAPEPSSWRARLTIYTNEAQPLLCTSMITWGFMPSRWATSPPAPTMGRSGIWECVSSTSTSASTSGP